MDEDKPRETENKPAELPAMVIKDIDTLKVISDPLRIRIVEMLRERPFTVKQVASELKTPATKLYYHFNMLEEHGFIKVVSTRIVSGIIEKQYMVTASSVTVDPSLFLGQESSQYESLEIVLSAVFDRAKEEIRQSVAKGLIDVNSVKSGAQHLMLLRNLHRFTPEQIETVFDKLSSVLKELDKLECAEDQGQAFGMTVAVYPVVTVSPEMANEPETPTGEGEDTNNG